MELTLLIILIIIANLVLYWLFFGKKKFEQKLKTPNPNPRPKTEDSRPK